MDQIFTNNRLETGGHGKDAAPGHTAAAGNGMHNAGCGLRLVRTRRRPWSVLSLSWAVDFGVF